MNTPDLIDVEVAIRYRDNPDSIDLSKATKITEKAAQALSRSKRPLILDGILELTLGCAQSFATFQGGYLSLKGLKKIEPKAAEFLLFMASMEKSPQKLQFFRDQCGGICNLDLEIAHFALKHPDSVDLSVATHISDEAADLLSDRWARRGYPRDLNLDGLVTISVQSARLLSEHQHELSLRGLKTVDAKTVKALSNRPGLLDLNGLEEIDSECAQALRFRKGNICLDGLRKIDGEIALALAQAVSYSNVLSLNGLREIDSKAAAALSKCTGWLSLNGLCEISTEVARELSGVQKRLVLDGLNNISEEAARALCEGQYATKPSYYKPMEISLECLTEVSDPVAHIFGNYSGIVMLHGLERVSIRSAKSLRKNDRIRTKIDFKLMFPVTITIKEAKRFIEDPESIDLSEASRISVEAADRLAGSEGLILAGISDLSSAVAMARGRGELFINLKNSMTLSPVKSEKDDGGSHTASMTAGEPNVKQHQMFNPVAEEMRFEDQFAEMERQSMPDNYDYYEEDTERESMYEDLASASEDFERSSEEGWYYSDRDNN